jgi:hypothetical protein
VYAPGQACGARSLSALREDTSLLPIDYDTDTLSRQGSRTRRRQHLQEQRSASHRVIAGYASEPSKIARAKDGTPLFDPIYRELTDNAFDGLRDIAAGICGVKVHNVVELPQGTAKNLLGYLADCVKLARESHSDLPPCCRMVKELGQRETLQTQLADQVKMVL